jgi:uncharacterized protein
MVILNRFRRPSMTRIPALILATSMMLPATQAGAQAGPTSAQPFLVPASGPLISLAITESVESAPDIAIIGTGVQTNAVSAKTAMSDNAALIDKMIAALVKAGIARKDIQTSGLNLSPQYDYSNSNGQPPRFMGYQASNQLTVTIRKIADAGPMIDALVNAGATNISGPSFSVADQEKLVQQARSKAMETARQRADFYAKAAGYARARLVSLAEGGGYAPPMPMVSMRAMASAEDAQTKIEPGQVSTSVSINFQYVLER